MSLRPSPLRARLARARAHAGSAGFSLIEVLVVVVLVTLLTALAVPTMGEARKERLAHELTRSVGGLVTTARTRAMARGSAHLLLLTTEAGAPATFLLFEARDPVGRPQSSCRTAGTWTLPAGSATNQLVERVDFSTGAIADLVGTLQVDGVDAAAVVMCATPGGRLYVRSGSGAQGAANLLETAQPFTGLVEVRSTRLRGGVQTGPTRRLLLPAAGSPRLVSEGA